MSGESILVVEDDAIVALHLSELLERRKYRVSGTAAYGEDALEMAKKDPPDLVFMDIGLMGKIDGIETARRILEHADIPIIYLSGHVDSQRLARVKETAPYWYLVKPYNEEELLAAIEISLYPENNRPPAPRDPAALPGDCRQCCGKYPAGFHRYREDHRS